MPVAPDDEDEGKHDTFDDRFDALNNGEDEPFDDRFHANPRDEDDQAAPDMWNIDPSYGATDGQSAKPSDVGEQRLAEAPTEPAEEIDPDMDDLGGDFDPVYCARCETITSANTHDCSTWCPDTFDENYDAAEANADPKAIVMDEEDEHDTYDNPSDPANCEENCDPLTADNAVDCADSCPDAFREQLGRPDDALRPGEAIGDDEKASGGGAGGGGGSGWDDNEDSDDWLEWLAQRFRVPPTTSFELTDEDGHPIDLQGNRLDDNDTHDAELTFEVSQRKRLVTVLELTA
jgi:hypothetical protein